MKKFLMTFAVLFAMVLPAHASASVFFFSKEDPQSMLKKHYKAYVVARTFTPGLLRRYRAHLIDSSRPLPKSLRSFVDTNIDWTTYARSIFGFNWHKLTATQKKDFESLLRKLHIKKYGKHFSPDTKFSTRFNKSTSYRVFKGEEFARVSTMFTTTKRNVRFDIDFVFFKGKERWALCDVYVDGVSHSRTYRGQVKRIYNKKGYEGVMSAFRRALSRS